jgi:hypothetical protein
MRKRIVQWVWCILLAVLLGNSIVLGDGKYFPEKVYKASPSIPAQRALLVYKDGVETLVIESALQGQGKNFGWVIPVPAKPTEFEKASAGFLDTLSLNLQPMIIDKPPMIVGTSCFIAVIATVCYFMTVCKWPRSSLGSTVFLLVILLVLGALFMPNLGVNPSGTSTSMNPIRVVETSDVGDYVLTVLEADTPKALDEWLSVHGFAELTKEEETIVASYIQEGWYFIVAKLRLDREGLTKGHPIAMKFPAKQAVYPMRLTGTTGSNVYLDLFVVAEAKAVHSNLKLECADLYTKDPIRPRDMFANDKVVSLFEGHTYKYSVGHPDHTNYLWDRCVISRLCGVLGPEQMKDDLNLSFDGQTPSRKVYYSVQGARSMGLGFALNIWWITLLVSTVVLSRGKQDRITPSIVKRSVLLALILSFLAFWIGPVSLSKIEVGKEPLWAWIWNKSSYGPSLEIGSVAQEFGYFEGIRKEDATSKLKGFLLCSGLQNAFTAKSISFEDSPGNWDLTEQEGHLALRTFSREGIPASISLSDESIRKAIRDESEIDKNIRDLVSPNDQLNGTVLEDLSSRIHRPGEHAAILARLYEKQPKQWIPSVIASVESRISGQRSASDLRTQERTIRYGLGILGCICHLEPPADINNEVAIKKFFADVRTWYGSVSDGTGS